MSFIILSVRLVSSLTRDAVWWCETCHGKSLPSWLHRSRFTLRPTYWRGRVLIKASFR